MKVENIRGCQKVRATKKQIIEAFYLLLDEALPKLDCKLIEQRGNYMCDRCDDCTFNQLIHRVKRGEQCRKTSKR